MKTLGLDTGNWRTPSMIYASIAESTLAPGSAEEAVRTARAMKLAGINVTSPFKEEIINLLDGADARGGCRSSSKRRPRSSSPF